MLSTDPDTDEGHLWLRNGVSHHLACAGHSPLPDTDVLAVTLQELSRLLFLYLQAVTFLSNGDGMSGQITPRMMGRDKR